MRDDVGGILRAAARSDPVAGCGLARCADNEGKLLPVPWRAATFHARQR